MSECKRRLCDVKGCQGRCKTDEPKRHVFAEFKADCSYLGHENGEWCMLDNDDCSEKRCPLFKLDRQL